MTNEERRAALEAIIYAADEPATVEQLAAALDEEKLVVQASLDELVASYAVEERGIEVRAVAGGYKMYTKPQHHDLVRRFIKSLRPPLRLRGPVTRADGGKMGVGRGYGGARIDLESLSTTDPHSRALLAAQIIWTLARADIRGPYVINADGAPLDDRFAEGWTTSDVAATDPGVADGAGAGAGS